jgi:MFS family permease
LAQTELSRNAVESADGPPMSATPWAWGVCWLMFASTVLNYMDRQAMALVSPYIRAEFHLTDEGFGWVLAAFYLTYAVFQVPAGYLVDRGDVHKTYAAAVAWWSLAGIAAAFSPTLGILLFMRAMLGVGESFNWPCALRITALVLPSSDRSLGNGIFNSGAAIGAVITPLVVPWLTVRYGWRTAFVAVGSLGFLWVVVWLMALGGGRRRLPVNTRRVAVLDPEKARRGEATTLSPVARYAFGGLLASALLIGLTAYLSGFKLNSVWFALAWTMFGMLAVARALPLPALRGADWAESLGEIVRLRRFWVLLPGSLAINICWHFLAGWLPTYLTDDRGMTFLASGIWTAVPFLAADVGNLGGGALSRAIAVRGVAPTRARLLVLTLCTALVTSGAWVGLVQSNWVVIALLAVMAMATAAFMANGFVFAQEISARHTGLIVGILGGLANLCVAGFLPFAGMIKDTTGGFGLVFVIVGLLPIIGLGSLAIGWGHDEPALHGPGDDAEPA